MSNIIELKKKEKTEENSSPKEEINFDEIMKANKLKEEKMKQERNKANRGVIRSYRLKK